MPVVMVTCLAQSFSRRRVAGPSSTPMVATRLPERTGSAASSKASGKPTASMVTSAP